MSDIDRMADWLISELKLKSTLFHVGQYCGTWQASTAGRGHASFHAILHGNCWLHVPPRPGRAPESIPLTSGDAVFLLRDMPHCLSPAEGSPALHDAVTRFGTMLPLTEVAGPDSRRDHEDSARPGVGLACGFFEFDSEIHDSVLGVLPDYIVARHDDPKLHGASNVFELLRAEALRSGDTPSAMVTRLTDLLFFYALRAVAVTEEVAPGLWSLMMRAEFAPLVSAIIDEPATNWTTASMATFVHMSRARFCKQFVEVSSMPPAQFVTAIRMKVAAAMLRDGAHISLVAGHVGYQSESAFSQAFKRTMGVLPGAYRRDKAQSPFPQAVSIGGAVH